MTTLAEFRDRYEALVVAACEWRAMQAVARVLAERVFGMLADLPTPPDLPKTYRVIEKVVLDAYIESSASRSILDQLRGEKSPVPNAPADTKEEAVLRDAVSRLGRRDREVLQLSYWDELTEAEVADVLATDVPTLRERRERALDRYRSVLRRRAPSADLAAASQLFRSVKPGLRTRWE